MLWGCLSPTMYVSVSTERTVSVLQGYSFNKAIWLATVCEALLWVSGIH